MTEGNREQDSLSDEFDSQLREAMALVPRPGARIGGYQLLDRIGQGGQGEVWTARHPTLPGAIHALKLIPRTKALESDDAVDRYERRMRTAERIEHPGVARIYGFGHDQVWIWLAQEWIAHGKSLASWIRDFDSEVKATAWSRKVARFGVQIAAALEALHQAGLVHRDLSPANVLVDGERMVLIDLGFAQSVDDDLTLTSRSLPFEGTVSYASPEKLHGRRLETPASDQISLGAILWELATLRRPYPGRNAIEIFRSRERRPLPPWPHHAAEVPEPLSRII
ncbi:MAG: serine/threonine-protein kinase, partial [Planctomycetota bacterium]